MKNSIDQQIILAQRESQFSGSIFVKQGKSTLAECSFGYANRSEELSNIADTRYGIASGCKIFTAVAVSQLVEAGKLYFDQKLKDCLSYNFPYFDESITIHHLLTHTSGIPDYFDEEIMEDFEELWIDKPMYHMRKLEDFLPFFQEGKMKFNPGERFHYNNAGYILLGLIIEQASGLSFQQYIEKNIFEKAGMKSSGYFAMDALPKNTALGYIDKADGTWKTNIYSIPVQGGADGGAFITAADMVLFWEALLDNKFLSEETTSALLYPHVQEQDDDYYGYGVWIKKSGNNINKYHVMGYDPGVSFHSAYYPAQQIKLAVCSNKSKGAFAMLKVIEQTQEL
ncbi:serine hydrolase domain-containing protein [Psychrobacillus sp. FSL K6-1267]|jgi:CubicO group peptidase (beta-lactamase class C family)|uniref:serine hydrolase domain-containing protein n=1 Tax=Psychrobacillus sp. FSL K6-1267 TaxID=2921543 RepID=UPI0030FB458A